MGSPDNLELAVNHAITSYRESLLRQQAAAGGGMGLDAKRSTAWAEYGFKDTLVYQDFYNLDRRGGLAHGATVKLAGNCWKTAPWIIEGDKKDEAAKETSWERSLKPVLMRGRLWQAFKKADRRRLVGRFSGMILHIADGKEWDSPVENKAPITKITVAWAGQLRPNNIEGDTSSTNYGMPQSWTYAANLVPGSTEVTTTIHPDRIFILGDWQGTDPYFLEPAYNSFVSLEKVEGGSGESFLKNAARQLAINFDKEIDLKKIAQVYGVTIDKLQERFNEAAREINQGSDSLLITQGASTAPLVANTPDPTATYDINLQSACAAIDIPTKILVGMQTGERASSEDQKYFNSRCQSRRMDLSFDIYDFFDHLIRIKVVDEVIEYTVMWDDLTEPTLADKLANAKTMAEINNTGLGVGETYFTQEQIITTAGFDVEGSEVAPLPEEEVEESGND